MHVPARLVPTIQGIAKGTLVAVPVEPTEADLKPIAKYIASMVGDPYGSWQHFLTEAKAARRAMLAAAQEPPR